MSAVSAILTIAHLTLSEARRRRVALAALLCGLAFLTVYTTGLFFAYRELATETLLERQAAMVILTLAGLYAANFLAVLFAVLLPVDALSGEIDSGIMQSLASKPIARAAIVLGKWLGHGTVITAYLVLLFGGVLLVTRVISGYFPVAALSAVLLVLLELAVLLTVSIAGGTRLSTVTNGVMALGFYGVAFVGGWMEQIGAFAGVQSARTVGIVASLLSPADSLWRLAAYQLQPEIVRNFGAGPFTAASVPSALMVWWAAAFTLLTLLWAIRSFNRRAL